MLGSLGDLDIVLLTVCTALSTTINDAWRSGSCRDRNLTRTWRPRVFPPPALKGNENFVRDYDGVANQTQVDPAMREAKRRLGDAPPTIACSRVCGRHLPRNNYSTENLPRMESWATTAAGAAAAHRPCILHILSPYHAIRRSRNRNGYAVGHHYCSPILDPVATLGPRAVRILLAAYSEACRAHRSGGAGPDA